MPKKWVDLLALGSCAFVLIVWVGVLNFKYYHFGYFDWDLAFFSQAMWGLLHGTTYVSVFDLHFFANHDNFIVFFLLPLYFIFPHPMTLVYLKVISYVSAGFIIYILAKEKLEEKAALLILWLYLLYPPNMFGLIYEFDVESLAPLFLMLLYYFYVKERWRAFMITAGILIITKENLPLVVMAFGIHGLFAKKDKLRWGLAPATLGLFSVLLYVFVLTPLMSGRPIGQPDPYYITASYQQASFSPLKIWHVLMAPMNVRWLYEVFTPFLYLPFAAPGTLFLISPIIAQHLFSNFWTQHSIFYSYLLTIAPFIFLAMINVLERFAQRPKKTLYHMILFYMLVMSSFGLWFHSGRMMAYCGSAFPISLTQERWAMVRMVPKDASVITTFDFLPALSHRRGLYAFYKVYNPDYSGYQVPRTVQYALIDFHDNSLADYMTTGLARRLVRKFLVSGEWSVEKNDHGIVLFKRKV